MQLGETSDDVLGHSCVLKHLLDVLSAAIQNPSTLNIKFVLVRSSHNAD
jgi:hypothetical protein